MADTKPTLKQLEYFVCLAETGTFRGAAERLGISQPTLSGQIYNLEKTLELSLMERGRSGATLTPAGRALLGNARQVIEEMNGLVDQAAMINDGPGGTFRMGVSPSVGPYLLPHILPDLHREHAKLKLYVREAMPQNLELDLQEGRLDLVLMPLPFNHRAFVTDELFHEPLHLVAPAEHRFAEQSHILADQLQGESVLTLEKGYSHYHQVEQAAEHLGANILRDYEGSSLDALRQMVVMGLGIAFLPTLYLHSEVHQPQALLISDIENLPFSRTHVLAWRKNSPNRAFYRQLAASIRKLVQQNLSDANLKFTRA